MNLQTTVINDSGLLPRREWDEFCGDRYPFATVKWLMFLESIIVDYKPEYVMMRSDDDELQAICMFYKQQSFDLSDVLSNSLVSATAERVLSFIAPLSFSLPMIAMPGLLVSNPNHDMMPAIAASIALIQKQRRSFFQSIYPVSRTDWSIAEYLPSFVSKPVLTDGVLDISWQSYDEYQSWLPRKKRAEIRRVRSRAVESGVSIQPLLLGNTDNAAIESLIANVLSRHKTRNPFVQNMVAIADKLLDEADYKHLVACKDGNIIGSLTLFISGKTGIVRWAGLDYAQTEKTYAYHYLMSETVRLAIELGLSQLKLGGTVLTLKKQLGASLDERAVLMSLRNPVLNKLLAFGLKYM